MKVVRRVSTETGTDFLWHQHRVLQRLSLQRDRAWQLLRLAGPTWAVATFRCYLTNRKRFNDRSKLEQALRSLDLTKINSVEEFFNQMQLRALRCPDARHEDQPLTLNDLPGVMKALIFLAQRY